MALKEGMLSDCAACSKPGAARGRVGKALCPSCKGSGEAAYKPAYKPAKKAKE